MILICFNFFLHTLFNTTEWKFFHFKIFSSKNHTTHTSFQQQPRDNKTILII